MTKKSFKTRDHNSSRIESKEQIDLKLLNETPIEDAYCKQNEISSNAKSKASNCRSICFTINTWLLLILATFLVILALSLFKWPLFELISNERLRMRPFLLPFQLWAKPAPVVYCTMYIFTVTNSRAFLNGTDKKMKVKEFGPIIFREHLQHNDIVFHENSTLSYTALRYLELLPELNEPGIMNRTITVPNIVLLGMVTRLAGHMFTVKVPFNMLSQGDEVFINTTVYDYLWNLTTPTLKTVVKYLPFLAPLDNAGVLHTIYNNFNDRVNVRIGPKYNAQEFFTIHTYNYRPTVPGFRPEHGDCYADFMNASEGAIYPNRVTKDFIVYYWRKAVCRPIPLYFKNEVQVGSLKGYKYVVHADWYDRKENLTADCYKGFGSTPLADGLSDVSKCYSDLPIAVSAPHFLGRSGYWNDRVEGYNPDYESHISYTIIEPLNGIPLEQKARSQSNFILPKLSGFNRDVNKFSETVVPMFWIEYSLPKLTSVINAVLIFMTNILPHIQYAVPVIFLLFGLVLYYLAIRRANRHVSIDGYSRLMLLWRTKKSLLFKSKTTDK